MTLPSAPAQAPGAIEPAAVAGSVLVLRAIGLGDALTGIPALRALRRAHPDRPLLLAAGSAVGRFLVAAGVVDGFLPTRDLAPLPAVSPPFLAVDLHGNGPASHDVVAATRALHLLTFASPDAGYPDGPVWRRDEHEVLRWCRLAAEVVPAALAGTPDDLLLAPTWDDGPGAGPDAPVVLHPGAAFGSRRWPASRFAELATALVDEGHRIVLTGGADEVELCAAVVAGMPAHARAAVRVTAGALDLPALVETVRTARLVVSGDTGAAHVATAVRTPSVLLFGPTPPRWWGPLVDLDRHPVLWPAAEGYRGDPHGSQVDAVLDRIDVAAVLGAVRDLVTGAENHSGVHELEEQR
ncbi:glycosyltransferase family 9 protein [Nakamurella leprariae]|uniref:Glycosyltransferase family 9 protein n=1 Tax=Nakamurella leprariae TaxID=2803911 RepID=A0A938YBC2_9ACTN|nr:glycosyltransferase family 9 protein [Nakamurella leprariae]MBM9469381.1 glycosyltransferase family 9 protein [Nakamurella leprariae]